MTMSKWLREGEIEGWNLCFVAIVEEDLEKYEKN